MTTQKAADQQFEIGMYASRTPIGVWVMSDANAAEISLIVEAALKRIQELEDLLAGER